MPSPAASPIAEALAAQRVLILDGALATELERRGADLKDPLWSAKCLLERPDIIREVHLDYLRAGADIVTTATYQATFEGFWDTRHRAGRRGPIDARRRFPRDWRTERVLVRAAEAG